MTMPAAPAIDPATGLPVVPPFVATVPAPVPVPTNEPVIPSGYVSEQDMLARIERARQEEKDKLYPRFEELSTSVRTLTQEREERLTVESTEQLRLADEARIAKEAEMDARTLAENYKSEMDTRFAALEEQRAIDQAIAQKEIQLAGLESYTVRRLSEEQNAILPELLDLVTGSSQEAVEESIAKMKERTSLIMTGVQEFIGQQPPQRIPPISVTGQPPIDSGAGNDPLDRQITHEEIGAMTMEEYTANRQDIRRAGSEYVRQNGIYAR